MHSTVFEISHYPTQVEKTEPPKYLPDWFYETVCDCTAKISDYEREHEIQQLTHLLGSQCTRNGNKLSFSPNFKQQYFKESFRYFKAAAEALAETDYDVFAGIVPAAAFDLALSGIAESYADKHSFYVYCPDNKELSPLDNWLRKTDLSEPVYIRDAINYHFYAKLHLQPKTVEKYKEELKDKIIPALGRIKLSELKPSTINSFFVSLTKDGIRKDGKKGGYARGSLYKTKNVLSSMLRSAVEWEIIDKNPCSKVRLPALPNTADNIKFFTPEQTITFLNYIEEPYTIKVQGHERTDDTGKKYTVGDYELHKQLPEQLIILFNLAVYGGFRKGELLALKFSDFDFNNCSVSISKSTTVQDGEQITKSPKTRSSVRTITLPKGLVERIAHLRETRKADKLIWGSDWKGDDWLFITSTGAMMNYSTPYQALQDTINRYNQGKEESEKLPVIPFHGLRHTSATLLISTNQDIATVSHRLGHAHTSVTLDIYTHALQKNDRNASEALEDLLENSRN